MMFGLGIIELAVLGAVILVVGIVIAAGLRKK
jgi:hypothetical protein